mmetsp:Transcript_28435/g.82247  ORF Transcript_28435/g.82247 Transcript_28435/m.82247 type:complete len:415 (+) Transcript_28435:109-1353(+)
MAGPGSDVSTTEDYEAEIWAAMNQTESSSQPSGEVVGISDDGEESRNEGGPFIKLLRENYYGFIGYSIALICGTLAAVFLLKVYLKRRFGISWCVGETYRNVNSDQLRSDAIVAARLQRELEAEVRQEALERKRKRRREQAEAALKDCTLVVEDGGNLIFVDHEVMVGERTDMDDGRELVLELPAATSTSNEQPSKNRPYRDARCAVCMMYYENCDEVIWSPNDECIHCYHSDCILTWLSRGKKKCPCCRMDFIPDKSENEGDDVGVTMQQRQVDNAGQTDEDEEPTAALDGEPSGNPVIIVVGSGEVEEEEGDDDDEDVLAQIIEQRALNVSAERSLAESHRSASTGGGRASVLSDSIRSISSGGRLIPLGGSHRSTTSTPSRGSPRRRGRERAHITIQPKNDRQPPTPSDCR